MGEGFFKDVYKIVEKIPEGKVATYGQIASILGKPRSARIVGYAMNGAPDDCKFCHRVVKKEGVLSPEAVFGKGVQKALLEREGVKFMKDGRIDMKESQWDGSTVLICNGSN